MQIVGDNQKKFLTNRKTWLKLYLGSSIVDTLRASGLGVWYWILDSSWTSDTSHVPCPFCPLAHQFHASSFCWWLYLSVCFLFSHQSLFFDLCHFLDNSVVYQPFCVQHLFYSSRLHGIDICVHVFALPLASSSPSNSSNLASFSCSFLLSWLSSRNRHFAVCVVVHWRLSARCVLWLDSSRGAELHWLSPAIRCGNCAACGVSCADFRLLSLPPLRDGFSAYGDLKERTCFEFVRNVSLITNKRITV